MPNAFWTAADQIGKLQDENARLRAELAQVKAERDKDILAEKMRTMDWCGKRQGVTSRAWQRAARKALAGDTAELRNRIAMIDAGPLDIVQSDAGGETEDATLSRIRADARRQALQEAADIVRSATKTEWIGGGTTTINTHPLADAILARIEEAGHG